MGFPDPVGSAVDPNGHQWLTYPCPVCHEETVCLWTDEGAPLSCGCALGQPHRYDPPRQGELF